MYSRVLSVTLLITSPVIAVAQDSTSQTSPTPFRKGQWAAQFEVDGLHFGSLGFIKFRSPTRALVLDLRILGAHSENLIDTTAGDRFAGVNSNAYAQVRFGWRGYFGDGHRSTIVTHHTLGALLGFDHAVIGGPNTGVSQRNGWTAGAFGELGATYLVTTRIGVGARGTASIAYTNTVGKDPGGAKSRSWSISGSALAGSLVATVFF